MKIHIVVTLIHDIGCNRDSIYGDICGVYKGESQAEKAVKEINRLNKNLTDENEQILADKYNAPEPFDEATYITYNAE